MNGHGFTRAAELHIEGVLATNAGDHRRARELLRASLSLDETNKVTWLRLSEVFAEEENWIEALHAAKIALNPRGRQRRRSRVHLAMGRYLKQLGRFAQDEYDRAEELWEGDRQAEVHMMNAFQVAPAFPDSSKRLHEVLALEPENEDTLCDLGWLHFAEEDFEGAEGWFRMALRLDPAHGALTTLGCAVKRHGRLGEGLELLRLAMALEPECQWVRLFISEALWDTGGAEQREEAAVHYALARKGYPGCEYFRDLGESPACAGEWRASRGLE